jgi:uncharacterized protein
MKASGSWVQPDYPSPPTPLPQGERGVKQRQNATLCQESVPFSPCGRRVRDEGKFHDHHQNCLHSSELNQTCPEQTLYRRASELRHLFQLLGLFLIGLVWIYRYTLRLILPPACRFQPSCSEYMIQAIRKYGPITGCIKGCRRVTRCHPGSEGGWDPP